jgi:hypothetical protein
MLTFDGHWHTGVVRSSQMNPGFNSTGQMADSVYGAMWAMRFADVNVVNRVPYGGSGVMVWVGISYGQRTQFHFIELPWRDPEAHRRAIHPPPSPHVSAWHARPHATRIYTQFLEAECPSSSMACILTRCVTQWACVGSSGSTCTNTSGTTFHRPQSTAWSTCEGDVLRCMRQMVVTPDTDRFSDPTFFLKYLWLTDAYLYSQSCEIHRLGPNPFQFQLTDFFIWTVTQ